MAVFEQDPNEKLDYQWNWADFLALGGADTIATSAFIVPAGITEVSSTNTTTTATIWLSGGTLGEHYDIVNRITTAGGRIKDCTMRLVIRQR